MIKTNKTVKTHDGKDAEASIAKITLSDDCTRWSAVLALYVDGVQINETKVVNFDVGGDPMVNLISLL